MPRAAAARAGAALQRGRHRARRPRRADVRQPRRVPRGLPRLRLDRRGLGADQHRVDGPADRLLPGRQRRAAAGDRGGFVERLAHADLRRTRAARRSGSSATTRAAPADGGIGTVRGRALSAHGRRATEPAAVASRRHARDPLHLGHHRPGQGRASARTRSTTVGRQQRAHPRASARDDVLCTTLPLFHINALNTFAPGGAGRLPRRLRAALLGLGLLAGDAARASATVVYLLGAMVPILLAQPASRGRARAPRAHRPRARRAGRRGRGVPRAHRRARCSKATARPRPTSSSRPRPTVRGPA